MEFYNLVKENLEYLSKNNYEFKKFSKSTRTSKEAADAIGCDVAQIGKSIIFKGENSEKPYLVIASGKNRINEAEISKIVGEPIKKGDAEFVKEKTGYIIGGVPPFGHDEDLFDYKEIWCAGGTPFSVFKISPEEKIINVK